jgi:hypothetical protein
LSHYLSRLASPIPASAVKQMPISLSRRAAREKLEALMAFTNR